MKNLFFIITAFALSMVSAIGPAAKANNITPTTIVVEKAGTLSTLLSQESMDTITSLILKGEINGDDVQVLRYMTGRDKDGEVSNGMLSELDMSEVLLKSGGWYDVDGVSCGILEDELPMYMFHQCSCLSKITLPNRCKGIRENAFSNCTSLFKIEIPSTTIKLGDYSFYNCTKLRSVIFKGSSLLEEIGKACFLGTAFTTFTLPQHVKKIASDAFSNCNKLQQFIVPEGSTLRTIEPGVFSGCYSLSTFSISENSKLEEIGTDAFYSCPLTFFYIPQYLKELKISWNMESTKSLSVHPDNRYFTEIDGIVYDRRNRNVLYKATDISKKIRIPEFISEITEGMFSNIKGVQFFVLPTSLTAIDKRAFTGCDDLQAIISPNADAPMVDVSSFDGIPVENISLYVPASSIDFYLNNGWNVFRKIEAFPTEPLMMLDKQDASAFLTSDLRSKTIFLNAVILTEEGLYDGIIDWQSSNTDVATVNEAGEVTAKTEGKATITASITYKGKIYSTTCNLQAIDITLHPNTYLVEAGRLKDIIPEEEKYNITTLILYGEINGDDVAFIRDMAGTDGDLKAAKGKLEVLDLTNVRVVEGGSYNAICEDEDSDGLITRETSTDAFGKAPFSHCSRLREVSLPTELKNIPVACFQYCTNLQKVHIPNKITRIDKLAFNDLFSPGKVMNTIDSLTIPSRLDSIGNKAFHAVGAVHLLDTIPAQLDKDNPAILGEGGCVIVPAKALDTYRNAEGWKTFYQQIIPDDAILEAEVTAEAREGESGLLAALGEKRAAWTRKLTIHGTINSWDILFIRNKMPILCELDLSDARIVANPKEYWTECHTETDRLSNCTFLNMKKLRKVRLPKILKHIGHSSFAGCFRLKNIEIPKGVSSIDMWAFYKCYGLKDVKTHEGLMSIGANAFEGSCIETINFPGSLRAIGEKAFYDCCYLKEVALPDAVRRIETQTF